MVLVRLWAPEYNFYRDYTRISCKNSSPVEMLGLHSQLRPPALVRDKARSPSIGNATLQGPVCTLSA